MNYRGLKHGSAAVIALGAVAGAAGTFLAEPVLAWAGASTAALAGLGRYIFGEAEERQREEAQHATSKPIANPAPTNPLVAHGEIDEAAKHIGEGRADLTVKLLERLRRERWDQLTDRERYRVIANLGNAKLAQRKTEDAARYYIRTVEYQPQDEDARAFQALGYLFLEEHGKARELSLNLCDDHPGLGRGHMIRIRTEPEETPLDELLESIPVAVQRHPEVALALYERAAAKGRLTDAESIIRRADLGEWPALPIALGSVILQQEVASLHITPDGPRGAHPQRLNEAVALLTRGLEKLSPGDVTAFEGYLRRGACQRLLGNLNQAREDLRKAHELVPTDEQANLALARIAYDEQKVDDAIEILERYLDQKASPEAEVLLAFLLRDRRGPGDEAEAEKRLTQVLPKLGELEESQRAEAVHSLAELYLSTERGDRALSLIQGPRGKTFSEAKQKVIEGRVLLGLNREDEARREAHAAKAALAHDPDDHSVRNVALLLEQLEQFRDAFDLWRRIVPPEFLSSDTRHLLRCARLASEDAFILEYCAQLRANGQYDQYALSLELEVLLKYSEYKKVREALLDYLAAKPDDKVVRLNLSAIAVEQGWQDLVETDAAGLPTLDDITNVEVGERVVHVLRFGPNPLEAVDYAYALYRRFPDEPAANRAVVISVLFPGHGALEIPEPEVVDTGVAVYYREEDALESKWLIVEDENPSLTRNEYPSGHPLVQAMLGKRAGDEFVFPGAAIRDRTGAVVELLDKRVFRANEIMRDWTSRFPDRFFVESLPVGPDPSPESFSEILKMLEAVNEQRELLEEMYSRGRIPVASFAHLAKKTVFESVHHVAHESHLAIRACLGTKEELQEAKHLLDDAALVVLDPTAVTTLVLLDEVHLVEELPFQLAVTEGTLQEIRRVIQERRPSSQSMGYLGARGGRLALQEIHQEAAAEYVEYLERVIADLEGGCEVLGGSDLAQLDASKREEILEYVARESAEAVAAAHSRDALLWSDDRFLHTLVNDYLPTSRVWTQAIFIWANDREILERERRSQVAARLLQFGYEFTGSDPLTVLDACEAAQWDPSEPHLAAVLRDFGNPRCTDDVALQMTAGSITRIWREAPTEEHARAVTAQALAHLADRHDHHRIVRRVKDSAGSLLGLAVTRVAALREALETYLRTGGFPL